MSEPIETRAQHLAWCKERAQKELDFYPDVREACRNALASMASDLRKHPLTKNHAGAELGMMMLFNDPPEAHDKEACRKFILGFN